MMMIKHGQEFEACTNKVQYVYVFTTKDGCSEDLDLKRLWLNKHRLFVGGRHAGATSGSWMNANSLAGLGATSVYSFKKRLDLNEWFTEKLKLSFYSLSYKLFVGCSVIGQVQYFNDSNFLCTELFLLADDIILQLTRSRNLGQSSADDRVTLLYYSINQWYARMLNLPIRFGARIR